MSKLCDLKQPQDFQLEVMRFKMPVRDHSEQRLDYEDISPRSPRKSVKFCAS